MNKVFLKLVKNFSVLNLALCLLCVNCTPPVKNVEEDSGVRELDIMATIFDNRKINLSTIASNIEYCLLETDEKCLVTPHMAVYCTKDYVVTIGNDRPSHAVCYVFDRKTGKFVRQISRQGQGPGEYTEVISSFWDGKKEQVCVWGNMKYLFYNLNGTLSHETNKFKPHILDFIAFDDYYVGYVPNSFGNSTIRIAFYDKNGALMDSIPNYRSWKKTQSWYTVNSDGWLYVFRDNLFYKDIYCDTLYHIKDFTLQPKYIFNTGGKTVPYEIQEGGQYDLMAAITGGEYDRYEKYIIIGKIFEDIKYLYFTIKHRKLLYPAVYDKEENKLQIMPHASIPRPSRDWRIPLYGFENDLDEGLPFWPQQMISEKEMMCVYTAEELLDLDSLKITDAKLKNVLNSLDEDSNPVVAIVTLKI